MNSMTTIGFIGSGNIGSQVARAAIAHGDDVVMSNSRGPETLAELVAELGEHARAATPAEAAAAGEIVVVTIPLKEHITRDLDLIYSNERPLAVAARSLALHIRANLQEAHGAEV